MAMTKRRLPTFGRERSFEPELAFSLLGFNPPITGSGRGRWKQTPFERAAAPAESDRAAGRWTPGRPTPFDPAPYGATFQLRRAVASFRADETPRSDGTRIPSRGSERGLSFSSPAPCPQRFYSRFQGSDITILE